jgi:hypothetical protein
MSNEQIKERYGIEPIMKEMWVWDDDYKKNAQLAFVLSKDTSHSNPYVGYDKNGTFLCRSNASETNPNEEPKVGDNGYFWDDEGDFYLFDTLLHIHEKNKSAFLPCRVNERFKFFSYEKQPWMK